MLCRGGKRRATWRATPRWDPESGRPKNGTLKYQLTDPRTAEEFAPTWDKTAGKWAVLDNVQVWFNEAVGGKQQGANGGC